MPISIIFMVENSATHEIQSHNSYFPSLNSSTLPSHKMNVCLFVFKEKHLLKLLYKIQKPLLRID